MWCLRTCREILALAMIVLATASGFGWPCRSYRPTGYYGQVQTPAAYVAPVAAVAPVAPVVPVAAAYHMPAAYYTPSYAVTYVPYVYHPAAMAPMLPQAPAGSGCNGGNVNYSGG